MKIIFDSEEEKNAIIEVNCPLEYGDYCIPRGSCTKIKCEECWRLSGIELEVKHD